MAKQAIDKLEAHYLAFINELVKKEESIAKAKGIISEHFEFLISFLKFHSAKH
jgi:aspartate kinase